MKGPPWGNERALREFLLGGPVPTLLGVWVVAFFLTEGGGVIPNGHWLSVSRRDRLGDPLQCGFASGLSFRSFGR